MTLEALRANPRVTVRTDGVPDPEGRCVVCWIQRAQRGVDNPAVDIAIEAANLLHLPVVACVGVVPAFPGANLRHYQFFAEGLTDLHADLQARSVPLVVRRLPEQSLELFCHEVRAALVIGDENPLREPARWRATLASRLPLPFWTVDADVVVPTRLLMKEQWAARTLRPRITPLIPRFLEPTPEPVALVAWDEHTRPAGLPADQSVLEGLVFADQTRPVAGWSGGTRHAEAALRRFVDTRLRGYAEQRNQPDLDGTSQLSPWLHFGHIGPRAVARAVREADAPAEDRNAFLEEFIVRRELAVNFVTYNAHYDSLDGCEPWARRTLAAHADDERGDLYPLDVLESAATHDPLWNAAQLQMVGTGWMHGYVRMYWAKKILEWSPSAEEAFARAVLLNDRYQLDGRDPNGYTGIAWAIGGKHDRAWGPERPAFGTIRYMSLASTSKKFNVRQYMARVEAVTGQRVCGNLVR